MCPFCNEEHEYRNRLTNERTCFMLEDDLAVALAPDEPPPSADLPPS